LEVWNALLDLKHRNDTFDDVLRDVLEEVGSTIPDTYDGA
jgi:hypothetical protein